MLFLQAYAPLGSPGSPGNDGPNVLSHPTVISIAKKLQKSPAQVALRWGIQMGQSVLPKSDNEVWTRENIDIFAWCIPEELMAKFYEIQQAWLHILTNYLLKAWYSKDFSWAVRSVCNMQVRLFKYEFLTHPTSFYKSLEDFWDGEI